jgi:hypothetical protein
VFHLLFVDRLVTSQIITLGESKTFIVETKHEWTKLDDELDQTVLDNSYNNDQNEKRSSEKEKGLLREVI